MANLFTANFPRTASRAHSIRGMATSTAVSRNVPLSSILDAATWSSATVFTSFYLRDVQFCSRFGVFIGSGGCWFNCLLFGCG